MIEHARNLLKNIFGYDHFRPHQAEVIQNVLSGNDTLVIMPTGGGKSLCYQIPALIFKGLTIVVSPLISLMKDQVEQLRAYGIPAIVLNSSLSYDEYQYNVQYLRSGQVKLLYLAPETLLQQRTLHLLSTIQVSCLTIDEAHCISEWGHDFRPEYRKIADVRKHFPHCTCIALTATATPKVQKDIAVNLKMAQANIFISSFDRPNLFLQVKDKVDALEQSIRFIKRYPKQAGIIYCFSRKQVDEVTANLQIFGYQARAYHAGLSDQDRQGAEEAFLKDDVQIIVATIAFGMGINKPNVKFVIHYDLPKNVESYYQQIGRAGRNGLPAHCLLLYTRGDIRKIKFFIKQMDFSERAVAESLLNSLIRFIETDRCRRPALLNYFGEKYSSAKCGMCDNCISEKHLPIDMTIPAQMFLSCVKRAGEKFASRYIADILHGVENSKIKSNKHHELSTYGIGTDYSIEQWMQLCRQLVHRGFVQEESQYGTLSLNDRSWDILRGKEIFWGKMEDEREKIPEEKTDLKKYDKELFEELRSLRKELADSENVPPYVIFPDKTLIDLATYFPQSKELFLQMHGVGYTKFDKYGQPFLGRITEYCEQYDIQEIPKATDKTNPLKKISLKKRKYITIGEAFNEGKSIHDLVTTYKIKQATVCDHIYRYHQEGHSLAQQDVAIASTLTEKDRQTVINLFYKRGTALLRPVYEDLEEKVSYDELHLLRIDFLVNH